jgi:CheY-like chemotaxis protein
MKLLVVDDHPLIVHALREVLPGLHEDIDVLCAHDREETLAVLARHPDCALVHLDLARRGAHGVALLADLRR